MGRGRRIVNEQRDLMRDLARDPLHLPEILILHAQAKLSPGAVSWAAGAARDPSAAMRTARREACTAARIDGAISGTPFLIALVPAYIAALWEQARLALRTAALSGRDPAAIDTAAELLVVRGVHPDVATAMRELDAARAGERLAAPSGLAGRTKAGYRLVVQVLMFSAFINPREGEAPSKLRRVIGFSFAAALWIFTVIVPLAFMALMAWSCESATKRMSELTASAWLPDLPPPPKETIFERAARIAGVAVLGVLPLTIVALGVTKPDDWPVALAAFVGLAEAFMLAALISRRGSFVPDD